MPIMTLAMTLEGAGLSVARGLRPVFGKYLLHEGF